MLVVKKLVIYSLPRKLEPMEALGGQGRIM
jgi:hypothetical protein